MSNHSKCVICQKPFVTKFEKIKQKVIGEEAILEAYIDTGILIPKTSRCCALHFKTNSNKLNEIALKNLISVSDSIQLSDLETTALLESLRHQAAKNSIFKKFEIPTNIDNNLCLRTTGLTSSQFNEVYNHLKSMRDSQSRTKSQALAIYLFWLKTGLSQTTIAAYFDNDDLSQQNISNFSEQIRHELSKSFVLNNIGAKSLTRAELCGHNTPFVRVFFDDSDNKKAALIADGTYLRCEKSSNNEFQRLSYSVQKKSSLVKPFLICAAVVILLTFMAYIQLLGMMQEY